MSSLLARLTRISPKKIDTGAGIVLFIGVEDLLVDAGLKLAEFGS